MSETEKIILKSTRWGERVIAPEAVLVFPEGILGFGEIRRYTLIPTAPNSPLIWLQSIDVGDLAFIICDPTVFKPDYKIQVRIEDVRVIELDKVEDARVYAILKIPENPEEMTANLKGPVVINPVKHLGMQLALNDPELPTQYRIVQHKENERRA